MAYNSGIVTAPVSIRDVQNALGSSYTDLGTLITSAYINKWAKFKPFRHSNLALVPVLDANGFPTKQTAVGSHYRCLAEANCGLYLATSFRNLGLQDVIVKAVAQMTAGNDDDVWEYQRPAGGSSQPFRLVDFCGYNNQALPFMWQSNVKSKKVEYTRGVELSFFTEIFDSSDESAEGMIEASDLQDSLYNGDSLYYVAVICYPYIINTPSETSYVMAYSIASQPISHTDGKTVSFTITKSGNNFVFNGTSSQHTSTATKYKVIHMLARKDESNNYTFLPIPFSSSHLPVTDLEIITESAKVEFGIDAFADFASNGSAISGLTFQSANNDISIQNWSGLTVRCTLTNVTSSAVTVNMGQVYCETNCHNGTVASTALYDSSYNAMSRSITINANSTINVYITFAGVFDSTTLSGADVEITLWGENEYGEPLIGLQSFGNDGTIIYHK